MHGQHQDEGGADDDDVLGKDAQRVEQDPGQHDPLAEPLEFGAPEDLDERAHHQHQPERGDDEDDGGRVAERAEEQPVHPEHREGGEGEGDREEEEGMPPGEEHQGEGQVGAEGHRLAVREVREAKDAEGQGDPDRAERVDAAEHEPRNEVEVDELDHRRPPPARGPFRARTSRSRWRPMRPIMAALPARFAPAAPLPLPPLRRMHRSDPGAGPGLGSSPGRSPARAQRRRAHPRGTSPPRPGPRGAPRRCRPGGCGRPRARIRDRRSREPAGRSAPP